MAAAAAAAAAAASYSAGFLSGELAGERHLPRVFSVSCRARNRNLNSQNRRRQAKTSTPRQPLVNVSIEPPVEENDKAAAHRTSTLQPQQKILPEIETASDVNVSRLLPAIREEKVEVPQNADATPANKSEDLVGMIRNAEKNILLLNQARLRALEDVDRIRSEKDALETELSSLHMKLAEAETQLKLAMEEKIGTENIENQLEKLTREISFSSVSDGAQVSASGRSLVEELDTVKGENMLLKADIHSLRERLTEVMETEDRVSTLEKERSSLEASLRELESRFMAAQNDVLRLTPLQSECQELWEKVENLQILLYNATKQVEEAAVVAERNNDLQGKVYQLEALLATSNLSAHSNHLDEILQDKVRALDQRLRISDREIHHQISLYQDSLEGFQEILSKLVEETAERSLQQTGDMPSEFWSRLLLLIDGWSFDKKISSSEAKILREMAWKRDRNIGNAYLQCRGSRENVIISELLKLTSTARPGLHIVHIAAEMAPVAKVGGLGDVVTGLCKELQRKGHLVEVVIPKYDCMLHDHVNDLKELDTVLQSYFDGNLYENKIWIGTVQGLPVYFIEPRHPSKFFSRGHYYGQHDDFKRFSFFSRAALELLYQSGKKPDIVHCHDWQTAFTAPLYWDIYATRGFNSARVCFTCHNFEYQGTAPVNDLASCGLDVERLNRPDRLQDRGHGRINVVKGAIVYSNIVTTVSPTYAQEVRSSEGSHGLGDTLKEHSRKFVGILNGIDTDVWNPCTDKFLRFQYSMDDLQGKAANKHYLRQQLQLSSVDISRPLVACVTRLVPQKGVHLIRHAIYRVAEFGGQFVLLGSSPVHHIQKEFENIANDFQNHPHVRLVLKYDEAFAHQIYAASDVFIVPSLFEPCGLTQMIAMRYGSIPVARKTGGLCDSVFDIEDETVPFEMRNGFTFAAANEQDLDRAMKRALNYYIRSPQLWDELVQRDMRIDFSWEAAAMQYASLYEKSVARAREASHT